MCLPQRRYVVSVKMEFGFLFDTPTGVHEFGTAEIRKLEGNQQYVKFNNDTTPIQTDGDGIVDFTNTRCIQAIDSQRLCTLHQFETLRVYRDFKSLIPLGCTIPEYTPQTMFPLRINQNVTQKWLHFVGDSNTHRLFKHLTEYKLELTHCFFGKYPSPIICTYPPTLPSPPNHGITFAVYTNWWLTPLTHPRNAFQGWTLTHLLEKDPYRTFIPKKERKLIWKRVKSTQNLPIRTLVSFGSHYEHQTPFGMNVTMSTIIRQMEKRKEKDWYKETARFMSEFPVLTYQLPPKHAKSTAHQNNIRIKERNQVVFNACRESGMQYMDVFGWGEAWGEYKQIGDARHFKEGKWKGMVYNRIADSILLDLGYRVQ
ncbi:hypothetical protein HDU79_002646 [Rhizoclosmatium sp. JEL0117]|nr:hypothetical protein HDU79_002646 [Rhizoclosmatium sp. JEL0117]